MADGFDARIVTRERRRRPWPLIVAALTAAILAATLVSRYSNSVRAQVGPLKQVLIARKDIPADKKIDPANAGAYFQQRLVAQRFLPQQYFTSAGELTGMKARVDIAAGTYISPGQFGGDAQGSANVQSKGTRVVEVAASGSGVAEQIGPGSRVDLVVTVGGDSGPGSSFLALEAAEVVAVGQAPDSGGSGSAGGPQILVSLLVTPRQAVYLTAAQNFAKQITVLPRPDGDTARIGPLSVSKSGLGQ